jgi:hypothetical protein
MVVLRASICGELLQVTSEQVQSLVHGKALGEF